MFRTALGTPSLVLLAMALSITAVPGCAGQQVPDHDGYREDGPRGWQKPQILTFDEDLEIEEDGDLSYPKRRRARWYGIEMPGDGEVEFKLIVAPLGIGSETDEEDPDDPFDVAFEVLDKNYRVLVRADNTEDDAGDRDRVRTVYELPKGRYYVHIYLQRRLDEAEYTLRAKFNRGQVEPITDFPKHVAFIEPLAVVPAFDDAPEPTSAPPRCRGKNCGKPSRPKPSTTPDKPQPQVDGLTGRIVDIRAAPGGTKIVIKRGSIDGVSAGWRGSVVNAAGRSIPNGDFTVADVNPTSCVATVKASVDSVKENKTVRLKAP